MPAQRDASQPRGMPPPTRLCPLLPTHEAGIPGQHVIDLSKCQSKQAGTGAQLPGRGVRSCLHRVTRMEEGGQPRGRKWPGCQAGMPAYRHTGFWGWGQRRLEEK